MGTLFTRMTPASRFISIVLLLIACIFGSILFGTKQISYVTAYSSFVTFDGSEDHVIIQTVRIPRTLIALVVGACLGMSGAIMQALTRNPLASPELLGINYGAALGVVCCLIFMQTTSTISHIWFAFIGATVAVCIVYVFSSIGHSGMTPMKLILAGASLTTLLVSITQGILLLSERALDEMRFWLSGSVSGRDLGVFLDVLPFIMVGIITALFLSKKIELLSIGEDVAKGLGQKTVLVKVIAILVIVLLAGSAVSIAGPISFIGLAVPHIARAFAGTNFRLILVYSAMLGAMLLLAADIGARFVLHPEDVHVGIMTAILGGPFFIYTARKKDWKL